MLLESAKNTLYQQDMLLESAKNTLYQQEMLLESAKNTLYQQDMLSQSISPKGLKVLRLMAQRQCSNLITLW